MAAKKRDTPLIMENLTSRSRKLLEKLAEIDVKSGGKLRFVGEFTAFFGEKTIVGVEKKGDSAIIRLRSGAREESLFLIDESGWKIDLPLSDAFYEPLR